MTSLPDKPHLPSEILPVFSSHIGRGLMADQPTIAGFVDQLDGFKQEFGVPADERLEIAYRLLPGVHICIATTTRRVINIQYPALIGTSCFSLIEINELPFYHSRDEEGGTYLNARLKTILPDGMCLHASAQVTDGALESFGRVMSTLFGRLWTQ